MKILCWNVRGLNSPLKQHEVAALLKKEHVDFCALVETKLSSHRIEQLRISRLQKWNITSNAMNSSNARIVLIWNPVSISLEVLHVSEQAIDVKVSCLISQSQFSACFVYGYNTIIQRRTLWDNLRDWNPTTPWMVMGDFNSILSLDDRHGVSQVSSYEYSDFHSCCMDLGLTDLLYAGNHYTWNRGNSWSKIDRVMVNRFWPTGALPVSVVFRPPGSLSDHAQAWIQIHEQQSHGRRNFKFFNMWTSHEKFMQMVDQYWVRRFRGHPMFILCSKLKSLKKPLKELNRHHFGHISARVARLSSDLERVQLLRLSNLDCNMLLEQEKNLRLQLVNMKSAEKMFYSQKLKFKFLEESDKGSKFFHSLMNQQHKRNFISAIDKRNGQSTTSLDEVGAIFVDHFKDLLGTARMTIDLDSSIISKGPCLEASDHNELLAPVTSDEIKASLFGIDNDKAPGPDGFSSLFFKKCWGIVGTDFCLAIKDFFSSGCLLKQINHSVIALIPKSANACTPSEFRPIACCNVIYKVISKLISGRLALALKKIVSPSQNAFLGGRKMSDSIHLIQELLRSYSRKRATPRCMLKVDFKKAFDSIQWNFIKNVLLQLGFPTSFVGLIMACVESATYSISVNGQLYGFFKGRSGIRQGDPLSPYLFITCMEYFSRMLLVASESAAFRFHPQCEFHKITHLAFADDVILLCKGDRESANCLLNQLSIFGQTSGLIVNASKSSIFFGGTKHSVKSQILRDSGFVEGTIPFRYLGVPLSPHRLLASQFSPLLQSLERSIQSWMGKNLSYAGRLELLKSVLSGIIQFWLAIFPIPSTVIAQITSICRNFLWTGDIKKCHSALVAWKKVCLPKEEGGLAILDLKTLNQCFLAKQLWDIHLMADTIWIQWIHHYYLWQQSIWEGFASKTASPLWKAIIATKDLLSNKFGSRESILGKFEIWKNGRMLRNIYSDLRPRRDLVNWNRGVWENWSLPKHSFILWLAINGKLRTKDRLTFTTTDSTCVLCREDLETHSHLFFQCPWTSVLWNSVKNWLGITSSFSSLQCAARSLSARKKEVNSRMRRVSLAILVYSIWEERNRRIFEGSSFSIAQLFRKFQITFFMIFHFHEKDDTVLKLGPM